MGFSSSECLVHEQVAVVPSRRSARLVGLQQAPSSPGSSEASLSTPVEPIVPPDHEEDDASPFQTCNIGIMQSQAFLGATNTLYAEN
jgi:hypothetical protein